jgi:hypothetical protein
MADRKSKRRAWYLANRAKALSYYQDWRTKNPQRVREIQRNTLLRRRGISASEYGLRLAAQDNCCAICRNSNAGGKWNCFTIDHDHETHEVRGLLCNSCNLGLGKFFDNPDLLQAAAEYLRQRSHSTRVPSDGTAATDVDPPGTIPVQHLLTFEGL